MTAASSPPKVAAITPQTPNDGAITRLLIAPLTFLTFLLSLALISARNDDHRRKSHPHPRPASPSSKGRSSSSDGSPYAYVRSPGSGENTATDKGTEGEGEKRHGQWYWHTKQREMMRLEVSEAFELRGKVVVALVVGVWVLLGGTVLAGAWWVRGWRW